MSNVNTNRFSNTFRIKKRKTEGNLKEVMKVQMEEQAIREQEKEIHFESVINNGETTKISVSNNEKAEILLPSDSSETLADSTVEVNNKNSAKPAEKHLKFKKEVEKKDEKKIRKTQSMTALLSVKWRGFIGKFKKVDSKTSESTPTVREVPEIVIDEYKTTDRFAKTLPSTCSESWVFVKDGSKTCGVVDDGNSGENQVENTLVSEENTTKIDDEVRSEKKDENLVQQEIILCDGNIKWFPEYEESVVRLVNLNGAGNNALKFQELSNVFVY
ncbi:hypothetical protein HK099_005328 [Clydaea vesicula]|uniref:Uncharacterized protein n=1 Tax=Clydaea vesicula TaxID=447962 RepID=A0AAD5U6G9_9FUNG|nr:hypothetical protein HK099_005328 [Clydaea vesicula]KAJ3381145.1 hypothetical protein HDU92_005563 [Lobulomyces angularis]